jgi:hypothetical protein
MAGFRTAGLALLLALAGCAPLTFSNEPSVDFAAYPSVSVELGGPDGSRRQSEYLESELREHSGFQRVTSARADASTSSAHLLVELALDLMDDGVFVLLSDDDQEPDISYSASVSYRLFARDGELLDSGVEDVEDEDSSFSAAESALDRVVLHYLRPYRL